MIKEMYKDLFKWTDEALKKGNIWSAIFWITCMIVWGSAVIGLVLGLFALFLVLLFEYPIQITVITLLFISTVVAILKWRRHVISNKTG